MDDDIRQRFYDAADDINSSNSQVGKAKKKIRVYKKRPVSAFKIYCKDLRHGLKRSHPQFSKNQIACILSNMWVNADRVTKLKYEQLSRRQFERYHRVRLMEIRAFNEILSTTISELEQFIYLVLHNNYLLI